MAIAVKRGSANDDADVHAAEKSAALETIKDAQSAAMVSDKVDTDAAAVRRSTVTGNGTVSGAVAEATGIVDLNESSGSAAGNPEAANAAEGAAGADGVDDAAEGTQGVDGAATAGGASSADGAAAAKGANTADADAAAKAIYDADALEDKEAEGYEEEEDVDYDTLPDDVYFEGADSVAMDGDEGGGDGQSNASAEGDVKKLTAAANVVKSRAAEDQAGAAKVGPADNATKAGPTGQVSHVASGDKATVKLSMAGASASSSLNLDRDANATDHFEYAFAQAEPPLYNTAAYWKKFKPSANHAAIAATSPDVFQGLPTAFEPKFR